MIDEIKKIIEKYEGEFIGYDSYQFLYCKWAKKAADEITERFLDQDLVRSLDVLTLL
jgi:hypothetical protein